MTAKALPKPASTTVFQRDEALARHLDSIDPLQEFRDRFHIPKKSNGDPVIYLCGNSLGLQPKGVRKLIEQELQDWEKHGVEAHFKGHTPWYSYHEVLKEKGSRLVGANASVAGRPSEVVMMNSLTVNLHLMLTTFYQPTKDRFRILMEDPAFPSDIYALKSHIQCRGIDPAKALLTIKPRKNEHTIRMDDLEELIAREGKSISLIMLAGVNFFTGQVIDMARISKLGNKHGCMVGFDLAHAAGNISLQLHEWNVDFAVWCSYKYLNSGPGAVAGCFVHERHGRNPSLPRIAGWWGNDPDTRFKMQLIPEFVPREGADGWQISNPPILSMAPVRASLDIFDEAGMDRLRTKSLMLTGYLRFLLEETSTISWEIITPRDAESHGCQLSILVKDHPRERYVALEQTGVVCDFREPNVIRVAPVPLYNTFLDCWRFAQIVDHQLDQ